MPTRRAQVVLPADSGLPRDAYVNTFHFVTDGTEAQDDAVCDALEAFYNTDPDGAGSGAAITSFITPQVSRTANMARIKVYDLVADGAPPEYERQWTVGAVGASYVTPLPAECAAKLSIRNDSVTAVPARNRRGGIYIGPLSAHVGINETGFFRVHTNLRDSATRAAQVMEATLNTAGIVWVIYSRTLAQTFPVETVWMDNEFDVIRSRGRRATTRTVITL